MADGRGLERFPLGCSIARRPSRCGGGRPGRSGLRPGRPPPQRDWDDQTGTALAKLDRPIGVVEERLPALVLAVGELQPEDGAGPGHDRGADEVHAGLAGGAAPLADVAAQAGADDVLPGGPAAPAAGDDVV